MKKKLSLGLAAGFLCAAILAGCGGGGSSETEPQTIGEPTAEAEESAQETEAVGPTGAQELTFGLNNEPDSLDPSYTNNSFAAPFLTNLFEGLVTYDENGEIAPGNAESWDVNEDMTVYTFHLREGLKWSDGTPLTAEIAAAALNTARGADSRYAARLAVISAVGTDEAGGLVITPSRPHRTPPALRGPPHPPGTPPPPPPQSPPQKKTPPPPRQLEHNLKYPPPPPPLREIRQPQQPILHHRQHLRQYIRHAPAHSHPPIIFLSSAYLSPL